MFFHSNQIEFGPENTGVIKGNLTLRGVTRSVTLEFVRAVDVNATASRDSINFSDGLAVKGKIKCSDFGMNESLGPIGDIVTLLVCYRVENCISAFAQPKRESVAITSKCIMNTFVRPDR
jgi:polyisoprenoid-binding protein YceI